MNELNTRAELLVAVRELRAELNAVIAEVGPERAVELGGFGPWTFKDLIAHLTGWRVVTAARLEAGLRDEEPEFPWPDHLDEENDLHEVNAWFYETNRAKSLEQVIVESNATFDRLERAIETPPEDVLLTPGRFDWIAWTDEALGPAVVRGTVEHYHVEHKPDIRAWLEQD